MNTACRKVLYCPHCGEINGTVKKVGPLKIIHEKYRSKKMAGERQFFEESFKNVKEESREIMPHLAKAQEDLNPLRTLNLFRSISASDCELLGLDPAVGRPEEFIWQYLSVPPVCIRPSVSQDAATNEDDLTVKLTEVIFTNGLIRNGLAKGIPMPSLMVGCSLTRMRSELTSCGRNNGNSYSSPSHFTSMPKCPEYNRKQVTSRYEVCVSASRESKDDSEAIFLESVWTSPEGQSSRQIQICESTR